MAKKQPSRKATLARKRPSRSEPVATSLETSLRDAAVFTLGGEACLGLVQYAHADPASAIRAFPVEIQDVGAHGTAAMPGYDAESLLGILREYFSLKDNDTPLLKVIGRILDVLLNYRGYSSCSSGDVLYVLLKETPAFLPYDAKDYKLSTPTKYGRDYDVTRDPASRTIKNRINKLVDEQWVSKADATNVKSGVILTVRGQLLFDGWPHLRDIPNLELESPAGPPPATRRRTRKAR